MNADEVLEVYLLPPRRRGEESLVRLGMSETRLVQQALRLAHDPAVMADHPVECGIIRRQLAQVQGRR